MGNNISLAKMITEIVILSQDFVANSGGCEGHHGCDGSPNRCPYDCNDCYDCNDYCEDS